MKLTYGQLELTLASHLCIHPDKVPTLRSRIKQLQRLQFPPGVNVGRGLKMEYTSEHLFMLVTAFELIGFGLPAQTACNLVKEHWKHLAAGYALSALQAREYSQDNKGNFEQVLAILWMRSLHDIQFNPDWGDVHPSYVKICDESVAKRELKPLEFSRDYTRLFLSIGKLQSRVLTIAKERAGVKQATCMSEAFHSWLPQGDMSGIDFASKYPDRSNLQIRRRFQQTYGSDPESLTPEGAEEANEFLANDYGPAVPF